jgi:N-sulfoglucosamine sulfohydrolase
VNGLIPAGVLIALSVLCSEISHGTEQPDRPNVVYIAIEDITPMMGCYGDTYAKTPNFDQLAQEGIRYTLAYSVGPVCSVSRSSIVTGMYPTSIGTMHHRSRVGDPPAFLKMIPNLMREAGYFTTNNKTDYNIQGAQWHKSKSKDMEGWRHRTDRSQPFFCKFDFAESHSSITKIPEDVIVQQRLNRLKPEDFHDPATAPIPPYHPADPAFRKAWSRYYDAVTQVDYRAGELIDRLKEDGLWDDTIVIVWADHGVGMPRGKHMLWEQGTHVPLIVRYPKKYQHLAAAEPGSVVDDLVCLMDLGPSVLKMVGIKPPNYMHGRALLCQSDAKKRDYVVSVRNRLDIRSEMVRSIRDKRYRYQRNFYPHLPFAPYQTAQFAAPVYMRWAELARDGKLEGSQEEYALRFKPLEQLYDSENDPHMIKNVADDPAYAEVLEQMRRRLYDWMVETRDMGILEEHEINRRAKGRPLWKVGQELDNYEGILETANLQLQGLDAVEELKTRSEDANSLVRFWAVLGLVVITQTAGAETIEGIVPILEKALADDSVDVRLIASEGLFNLGQYEEALPVLIDAMNHPSAEVLVRVGNILDSQPPDANDQLQPAIGPLEEAIKRFKSQRRIRGAMNPFIRAYKAITGQEVYYRWGMGASGSPESPLMAVQKTPFSESTSHEK